MQPVCWKDTPINEGKRTVLTDQTMRVPGLKTLGRHFTNMAIEPLRQHYHPDCFEIVFVAKGTANFTVQNIDYALTGGDLFVTLPNEVHSNGEFPMSSNGIYWFQLDVSNPERFLMIHPEWANNLIQNLYHIENRVLQTNAREFRSNIAKLFDQMNQDGDANRFAACSHLLVLLHMIIESDKRTAFKLTPDIAESVYYILDHLHEDIALEQAAQVAGLSVSRFKEKFKSAMGVTPRNFINLSKVNQAKTMLLSGKSVTDTAMELGFTTSNYFSVVFRKYTMLSPREFVQKNKNNDD